MARYTIKIYDDGFHGFERHFVHLYEYRPCTCTVAHQTTAPTTVYCC